MEACTKNHAECSARLSGRACTIVLHHIFHPESAYTTPLEIEFRELITNRVPMCEYEEKRLHLETAPPPKPTKKLMEYCVAQNTLRESLAARELRT